MDTRYDVCIVGGGPAGSSVGAFLRKYGPDVRVSILERERFPRDHVGESQLPLVSRLLNEVGVWDKVEAAEFPIKVGATYRWGKTDDLWDFHFIPQGKLGEEARPAAYSGQRTQTAFQVDRAVYDQILLQHAAELGCEVRQECAVREVLREGDRITGLRLSDGEEITARFYVDGTGHAGLIRRAFGVHLEEPSNLKNIAIWDYWRNAEWAMTTGVGGTRVQVMSIQYGWLWFIPLGPDRTSVGLVCPADYYKNSGLTTEELYVQAISEEPLIRSLVANASRENSLSTTKDWSFVAGRSYGENWALAGEALGFADPILAAGLTLTHVSARECAFSILEEFRGGDRDWIWSNYAEKNQRRIRQHIRFADYWYTANANFSDLKEFTAQIAGDAGLELDAEKAFQWLGTGGFVEEDMGIGGFGTVGIQALHQITNRMSDQPTQPQIDGMNWFELIREGASVSKGTRYLEGRVIPVQVVKRGNKTLPMSGYFGMIVDGLRASPRGDDLLCFMEAACLKIGDRFAGTTREAFICCLEAMVRDGWVKARREEGIPSLDFRVEHDNAIIGENRDASNRRV